MKWIINLIGKWTGVSAIIKKVDGYKTIIGAVSLILSGLAQLTQEISILTDFASVLDFAKQLPGDAGWIALLAGIAAIGLGHKADKAKLPK